MPGQPNVRFRIRGTDNEDLRKLGCSPWVYYATTNLYFSSSGRNPKISLLLPFRLDTGAFVSTIPQNWLDEMRIEQFLEDLSTKKIPFRTAAGKANGRVARDVLVKFQDDPSRNYQFDFMVTSGLNKHNFGLLALRDVIRHFALETEGGFRTESSGEPIALPDLVLYLRDGSQRIKYRCESLDCPSVVWGGHGLNLRCDDHNRPLVSM